MKLDKRIIDGKKPLDCFDTDIARQFIGKKGYFAEDLSIYANVGYAETKTLQEIADNKTHCFKDDVIDVRWSYFLPEEWVQEEEPEPEWRPYLIDEWLQDYDFGDMVEFRTKINHVEITAMFIGLDSDPLNGGRTRIMLGCNAYSFDSLFEHYELIDKTNDGKFAWRPFGIEVKE